MKTWINYKDLLKQLPRFIKFENHYLELFVNYNSGIEMWEVGYEDKYTAFRIFYNCYEDICEALKCTLLEVEEYDSQRVDRLS